METPALAAALTAFDIGAYVTLAVTMIASGLGVVLGAKFGWIGLRKLISWARSAMG